MTGVITLLDQPRTLDSLARPTSAVISFYLTGTTTLANIYSDVGLTTPTTNPISISSGELFPDIFLDPSITYRRRIVYGDGTIHDVDPYPSGAAPLAKLADGTVSAPALSFTSETDSGLYRPSSGTISVSISGTQVASWNSVGYTIGGSPSNLSKLTVYTKTTEVKNGFDIYHYADQTFAANQTSPFVIHNYTDGVSQIIDTVGSGISMTFRQARNPTARADKPSNYVGDGIFWDAQRTRVSGSGNLGSGNDRLAMLDAQGSLRFYGANGADWTGTDTTAPIILGSYTGFFTKTGYLGFDYTNSRLVVGSIESGVSFLPIQLACSAVQFLGDGTVNLASPTNRLGTVHTVNVKTSGVTVATLPAAGTIGAGARAFVNDSTVAGSGNFGAIVAGGGSNNVPVYSDGTNWRIG